MLQRRQCGACEGRGQYIEGKGKMEYNILIEKYIGLEEVSFVLDTKFFYEKMLLKKLS